MTEIGKRGQQVNFKGSVRVDQQLTTSDYINANGGVGTSGKSINCGTLKCTDANNGTGKIECKNLETTEEVKGNTLKAVDSVTAKSFLKDDTNNREVYLGDAAQIKVYEGAGGAKTDLSTWVGTKVNAFDLTEKLKTTENISTKVAQGKKVSIGQYKGPDIEIRGSKISISGAANNMTSIGAGTVALNTSGIFGLKYGLTSRESPSSADFEPFYARQEITYYDDLDVPNTKDPNIDTKAAYGKEKMQLGIATDYLSARNGLTVFRPYYEKNAQGVMEEKHATSFYTRYKLSAAWGSAIDPTTGLPTSERKPFVTFCDFVHFKEHVLMPCLDHIRVLPDQYKDTYKQ